MQALVVGATGATGSLLVRELLASGVAVRAVVRSVERVPPAERSNPGLSLIEGEILRMNHTEVACCVEGCGAVLSCLGHRMTARGIWGPPYRLVKATVRRLCAAVEAARPPAPVRFILMNTAGNRDRGQGERVSVPESAALAALRLLVPPHADNEDAAEYLRTRVGASHPFLQWAAVRPDTLVDEAAATPFELHPSPTRSALFNAGTTSRINVARFMARLATDDASWAEWKGRMPVIYNRTKGAGTD